MTTQYVTGTTTGTTPADTIRTALATPMANAGWTAVETATPGGTAAYDVYKSPGASNAIGTDWFLAIGRVDSTAANLQVRLFEQWDAVNKKAIKYAPSATSTPASDGSVNDGTGVLLNSATLYQAGPGSVAAGPVTYAFNITIDRIIFGLPTTPAVNYYGTYDRLLSSTDDPMPLVMLNTGYFSTATTNGGAATRELKNVGAATYNFFVQTGYGGTLVNAWTTSAVDNVFGSGDKVGADSIYFSGAYPVGRPIIHPSRGIQYTNRGVCKPGLYVASGVAGVVGDTMTVTKADGTTQACIWVGSYMYLATS